MLKHALFPLALATLLSLCVFEPAPGYGQGNGVRRDDREGEDRERPIARESRLNRDAPSRERTRQSEPCGEEIGRPCEGPAQVNRSDSRCAEESGIYCRPPR
jgi:hypothetical protein